MDPVKEVGTKQEKPQPRGENMRWTKRQFLAASASTFALPPGATRLGRRAKAQAGSVLRVIPHSDLKNLDPIWTTAYITRNHGYLIYDTLFAMDADFKPQQIGSASCRERVCQYV